MPRVKVPRARRHVARGVSLPPSLSRLANQRATKLEMSFSGYVQRLIEEDVRHTLLRRLEVGAACCAHAAETHARAVAAHCEEM